MWYHNKFLLSAWLLILPLYVAVGFIWHGISYFLYLWDAVPELPGAFKHRWHYATWF